MSGDSARVQEVRALLAKWTTNDWRRGFALAHALENTLRRSCNIDEREPILDGAGALAMPVRTRLGKLRFQEMLEALSPLALRLETRLSQAAADRQGDVAAALNALKLQEDVGPGLAKLAACRLGLEPSIAVRPFGPEPGSYGDRLRAPARPGPEPGGREVLDRPVEQDVVGLDLEELLAELEAEQPLVVEAARRLVADAESGGPTGDDDLALVRRWNRGLARAGSLAGSGGAAISLASLRALVVERVQAGSDAERGLALLRTLREIADAAVTEGARVVLATALDEAATAAADPGAVDAGRRDAFFALHRLLSTPSWEVGDAEVEAVEVAFGRRVARVAVAEVAIGA